MICEILKNLGLNQRINFVLMLCRTKKENGMLNKRIISIVITYIKLSLLGCFLIFIDGNYILANIQSIPIMDRVGYMIPLPSCLALSSILLLILYCLYHALIRIFDFLEELYLRAILGIILGFLIVFYFFHAFTFGGDWFFLDIGLVFTEFEIAILGGLIPYTEAYVYKKLLREGDE